MGRTRLRVSLVSVIVGATALAGCSSSSKTATPAPSTTTSAPATATKPTTLDRQVWLCKPGLASNPCLADLTATAVAKDGTKNEEGTVPAADHLIDCFYVYPTVSNQPAPNANLKIDPAETGVAIAQASRFSDVCNVYAPMYRQVTVYGLIQRGTANRTIPYTDVVRAWNDYLTRYNDGRGVVLIGHSQGAFILEQLIAQHIENAPVRSRLVSAILLGGNVTVKDGSSVGGTFHDIPACRSDKNLGCVIAYSSFDHPPPPNSLFGRTRKDGQHVLCTNPAALGGGSAPLDAYFPARRLVGPVNFTLDPLASTPWLRYPVGLTGECKDENGASWLQVDDARTQPNRLVVRDSLGPTWGLHVYDVNLTLGNLVDVVESEAAAYAAKG